MFDITILTEDRYLHPLKKNWYSEQVLLEDEILFESLKKKGLVVTRKSWSDKNFDWSNTNFAIIRSTWDYFDKIDEFSQFDGDVLREEKNFVLNIMKERCVQ